MSAAKNDGGPAFPRPPFTVADWHDSAAESGFVSTGQPGMSLRDWFAGQETLEDTDGEDLSASRLNALAGRPMPLPPAKKVPTELDWLEMEAWEADWRARLKFIRADAMLRAREGGAQ